MSGISPKLPLYKDTIDGYALNKTLKQTLSQNLKHVIMTIPGERVMNTDFGAGVAKYLFENFTPDVESKIRNDVSMQVTKYVPGVIIEDMEFTSSEEQLGNPLLSIKIFYSIPSESEIQILEI
tara:strand:+ start:133 stop:501 length:369 start_codon:yes stop_codon:yes gene_type:complete